MNDENKQDDRQDSRGVIDITIEVSKFVLRVAFKGPVAIAVAFAMFLLLAQQLSPSLLDGLLRNLVAPSISVDR